MILRYLSLEEETSGFLRKPTMEQDPVQVLCASSKRKHGITRQELTENTAISFISLLIKLN